MDRTHVVNVYGRAATQKSAVGEGGEGWDATPVHAAVECNIQPLRGSVEQVAAGRDVQASASGFFPYGIQLEADQAVKVIDGDGPTAFRITYVGVMGEGWDTEVLLEETDEELPS